MIVAALILAAGGSSRLGRPKQLEPWGNTTLLGHVVDQVRTYPVDEIWVVLGAEFDRILDTVDLTGCNVVENPEWEEGIASSLRVGLDALIQTSRADAALIVIGDQPNIDRKVVEEIVETFATAEVPVVLPKYRYTWGNPVMVDRSLWARLMSLEGDEGAQRLFKAHPEWVREVWTDQLPPRDVDTEADLEELRPRQAGSLAEGGEPPR
ncbi:MAG: nucleotidyltransferase family protein [Actinomycetes bacterium]|jgi:molybdenum cofactor cytidylyltransferase|nr:nucleotidyltransferase family protein [Acidimicrobiia bacterium]